MASDNTAKILYDGSLDTLFPNNIIVTTEQMTKNKIIQIKAQISKVEIYDHFILVYSSYNRSGLSTLFGPCLHKFVDVNIVSKTTVGHDCGHYILIDANQTIEQQSFLYDHFLFVIEVFNDKLKCYQPDTNIFTSCNITETDRKEFAANSLNLFVKIWHKMPFGSKRTFDPALLRDSKTIFAADTPVPTRSYNIRYSDLIVVVH